MFETEHIFLYQVGNASHGRYSAHFTGTLSSTSTSFALVSPFRERADAISKQGGATTRAWGFQGHPFGSAMCNARVPLLLET